MKNQRIFLAVLVFSGLAGYLVLFYATRMPSVEGVTGGVFRRVEFLNWLLLPDELLAQWCGSPPELALFDRIPVLAIAGLIVACSFSLGWLLMVLVGAERGLSRLEIFVFSTAAGLNLVSTYVLLVGLFGLLGSVWVFAVPAVLTLATTAWVGFRRNRNLAESLNRPERSRRQSPRLNEPGHDDWLSPRWLWMAAPFAVVIILGGMLPPVEFDVREYHLQVPKEFFQQGYVGFLPHNVYGNMPMGAEMLSLLAMVIAGDWWLGALAGKTVIAAFAPLAALGLFAAGRRFFSTGVGVAAALVYLSIPWIVQVSSLGLVEGALACYGFLAVYAVLLYREERTPGEPRREDPGRHARRDDRRHGTPRVPAMVLLAGYLAGGAVSCKYPALLFVVAPLALWILFSPASERARRRLDLKRLGSLGWRPLGVFLLAVIVGCGTWFAKNWALTGNPTYPLLYEVFGDRTNTWTPEKNRQWNRVHRPHDFSPRAVAQDATRVLLASEWLSPLVMPLAALAFLVRARRRLVVALAAYVGWVVLVWWLLTHRIDRFWIPVLPVVALLAGVGACWSRDAIWRPVLVGLLVLGSLSNFLVVASVGGGYTRYFVRLERLRYDPMRLDKWHDYFNTHARRGRVLLVGDAQGFDLEVPILYNTCFDDSIFERLVKGPPAEEVRAALAGEGISHVFVHWGEIRRYRSPGNYGFTDFVQPAVFERLVDQGILEPLPAIQGHPGRGYRVVSQSD